MAGGAPERTWGTPAPLSFVVSRPPGSHHRFPKTLRAWGGTLLGGGPRQLSSAPVSGSPVTADQGESWLFAREAAEIWGAIPCASFCLPGFPGRKSLLGNAQEIGRRSEREAGSSGFKQLCSCYFVCPDLLCLQTRAIPHVARDLGGRSRARSPGFRGDPFCLRQCRAWACTSSELGPAEARRSSLRPGRSTKCPTRAGA